MAMDSIGNISQAAYQSQVQATPVQTIPQAQPTRTVESPAKSEHETSERDPARSYDRGEHFDVTDSGRSSIAPEESTEALKKAVEEVNSKANNSEAQFAVHEGTNRIMVKIVDKKTKEVIKEFPPEKTLDLIAKAWELAGLTVDERR